MRPMLFTGKLDYNLGGYYNEKSNTIYFYTNDPVRDVLMNIPYTNIEDRNLEISNRNFKNNILHEYTYYAIDNFKEDNNIDSNSVSTWF